MRFSSSWVRAAAAVAVVVGASGMTSAPASAEGGRIAVVDMQRALVATEDGMRAQTSFKKKFDKLQMELDGKQKELRDVHDDIERQTLVLSRAAIERRAADWQRRMLELQTNYVEFQKDLQKKQADLTTPIIQKLVGIVGRIAKKNGYELIIDKQYTPYARADLDLTDQVIQMYNSGGDPGEPGDDKKGDDKKDEKKEAN